MTTSAAGNRLIVAVTVAGLAVFLGSVVLAARQPRRRHAHGELLRGTVQGDMHVAAGRSVAPRRDEPATPGDAQAGDTLHPGVETPAVGVESGGFRRGSGSPLDL
jgi:hypothetical protein